MLSMEDSLKSTAQKTGRWHVAARGTLAIDWGSWRYGLSAHCRDWRPFAPVWSLRFTGTDVQGQRGHTVIQMRLPSVHETTSSWLVTCHRRVGPAHMTPLVHRAQLPVHRLARWLSGKRCGARSGQCAHGCAATAACASRRDETTRPLALDQVVDRSASAAQCPGTAPMT